MQRGRLRVMVRYPLVVLVEQGRLSQEEAAWEMGLSTRQVRRAISLMLRPCRERSRISIHSSSLTIGPPLADPA